ncbi:MAG TPA: peptide-methionine (S)-S-oxide reductase MsrA [Candidatus Saccharimonadales bacterium]|nr:peptide-methionine (S)-S-oxide reductase MsrA [Candidatus Saccharimonadales bacterium]
MEQAIFAAGCFWGVQYYFDQIPGVTSTMVGYTGGTADEPTYEEVCSQKTGHAEAVLVEFKTDQVSFEDLCRHFFRLHDPTQLNRQGPDVGDQYRSAIFYVTDDQRETAERVRDELQQQFDRTIVTVIEKAGPFYQAEDYHQKYAEKTGRGMCHVPYRPLAK